MSGRPAEIDNFLTDWAAAEENGDLAALDELLTDDFTSVGPLGFTLTKAEWIDRHRTGSLRFTSFGLEDDRRVSVYRDVAVIVGPLIGKGTYQGRPLPEATRASLVLLRRPRGWRLTLVHMSFIAGAPGTPFPGTAATGTATHEARH